MERDLLNLNAPLLTGEGQHSEAVAKQGGVRP